MKVSIIMCSYNRVNLLRNTLKSIFRQNQDVEVIVVDDGSTDGTDCLIKEFPIIYKYNPSNGYGNQSKPMNIALKLASSKIIIMQSSEVIHKGDVIKKLIDAVENDPMVWCFARVANIINGKIDGYYVSSNRPRPFYFLCSLWRYHLDNIGGLDEDYNEPGYDDNDLADRLIKGVGLKLVFRDDINGEHQQHDVSYKNGKLIRARMRNLYEEKTRKWENGEISYIRNLTK